MYLQYSRREICISIADISHRVDACPQRRKDFVKMFELSIFRACSKVQKQDSTRT